MEGRKSIYPLLVNFHRKENNQNIYITLIGLDYEHMLYETLKFERMCLVPFYFILFKNEIYIPV